MEDGKKVENRWLMKSGEGNWALRYTGLMGSMEAGAALLCKAVALPVVLKVRFSDHQHHCHLSTCSSNTNSQGLLRSIESEAPEMPIWLATLLNKDLYILTLLSPQPPANGSKVKLDGEFSTYIDISFNQHERNWNYYRKNEEKL